MGREEQTEEREVLDSIFPDEIQDISPNEYRISILLEPAADSDETEENPTIVLTVRYPDAYPDEAPLLDITQPPNAPKHTFLHIHDDRAALLESLQPSIDENMGMAMIFTLVSALKDAAEQLITDRRQAVQAQKDLESRRAEEEENRKFEGQKVTAEAFLAWRDRFRKEMVEEAARRLAEAEAEDKKKRGGKADEKRLTGKQLWEQGLAGKTAEEDEDGEDVMEGFKHLKVEG